MLRDGRKQPYRLRSAPPPLLRLLFLCARSQDTDLPPLEEEHLDGRFDPAKAVHEANMAPPPGAGAGDGSAPAATPPVRARDLRLKGADAMVYLCAARLGLRPVVLRLVWDERRQVMDRPGWIFRACTIARVVLFKKILHMYKRQLSTFNLCNLSLFIHSSAVGGTQVCCSRAVAGPREGLALLVYTVAPNHLLVTNRGAPHQAAWHRRKERGIWGPSIQGWMLNVGILSSGNGASRMERTDFCCKLVWPTVSLAVVL